MLTRREIDPLADFCACSASGLFVAETFMKHVFYGLLVAVVTMVDRSSTVSRVIYWVCIVELNVLSIISLFTGFKVSFLPFKLCPVFFTGSSILILMGNLL